MRHTHTHTRTLPLKPSNLKPKNTIKSTGNTTANGKTCCYQAIPPFPFFSNCAAIVNPRKVTVRDIHNKRPFEAAAQVSRQSCLLRRRELRRRLLSPVLLFPPGSGMPKHTRPQSERSRWLLAEERDGSVWLL